MTSFDNDRVRELLKQIAHENTWDTEPGREFFALLLTRAQHVSENHPTHRYPDPSLPSELVAEAWFEIHKRGPLALAEEPSPLGLLHWVMGRAAIRITTARRYLISEQKRRDVTMPGNAYALAPTTVPERSLLDLEDAGHLSSLHRKNIDQDVTPARLAVRAALTALIEGLVRQGMESETAARVVARAWEVLENHSRASNRQHASAYADPILNHDLSRRQIRALIDLMSGPRRTPAGTSALAVMIEAALNSRPMRIEDTTLTAQRDLTVLATDNGTKSIGRAA